MADNNFGKAVPELGDIVRVDGDKLFDADGNEFSLEEIRANRDLGGGRNFIPASHVCISYIPRSAIRAKSSSDITTCANTSEPYVSANPLAFAFSTL